MLYLNKRLTKSSLLLQVAYKMGIVYSAPSGLSYFWNFGSLALLSLIIQISTGVFLAMFYTAHVDLAFDSVEHIMRDIPLGWVLRYVHANGASMFFAVVYSHIFRGFFFGSFYAPRNKLWISGVLILFIMIGTAFLGYVLPWGQMSFWAATVITNLATAIPIYGTDIVVWFWGAFSVDVPTLNRFFALHYLFPFILSGLILLHLFFLHEVKSGEPLGLSSVNIDGIPFGIYYIIKDFYGFIYYFITLFFLVFFFPNFLGHTDNYIVANAMVTPAHIVPEWYFLPFYAILRSITDKLQGVILMLVSIFILILFPMVFNKTLLTSFVPATGLFRPYYEKIVQLFVGSMLLLGWVGGNSAIAPYIQIGIIAMLFYFLCITYGVFLATLLEFVFLTDIPFKFVSTNRSYLKHEKGNMFKELIHIYLAKALYIYRRNVTHMNYKFFLVNWFLRKKNIFKFRRCVLKKKVFGSLTFHDLFRKKK